MSVFSKNWYRVEGLKPRLKPQVEISPQVHRGERKYALRDPISGSIQMFTDQAYQVIGLMDGERSLNQIWLQCGDLLQEELPTQEEVITLMSSLYQMDMLYLDVPANARDLFHRSDQKQQKKQLQKVYSPLSVQIPLFDPTRFLDWFCPRFDPLVGRGLLLIYVAVVALGLVTAAQEYDALTDNAVDRILAADNLFLLWFLYPLIKIVHELGHAYTVRRYGGNVHEVGIMFLVFFPMPYVNASESAAFSSKYQRMAVASAGLVVELFIAALAVILWSMATDGLVKSMLYNIAFMASVSTLLFNGNPLLKFDAYYVLSDWLEIPNLAKRGVSYWGYLFKKYIFRFREVEDPSVDARERYWLFFYNLFSFAYRLFISITIILFVGSKYFVIGVLLGIWTAISGWIIPFIKTVTKPFREPQFISQSRYPKMTVIVLAAIVWALLFELPLPNTLTATGVSWTRDRERLYAQESGFVRELTLPENRMVTQGQILVDLKNYELEARAERVGAQLDEARARLRSVYEDRAKSSVAAAELTRFQDEMAEVQLALSRTRVEAQVDGQLVLQEAGSLYDRFLRRGDVIGYVLHPQRPLTVRVAVPETAAEQVLGEVKAVSVRAASDRSHSIVAKVLTAVPRVSKEIPSPVLTTLGGGDIALDPSGEEEFLALENYVAIEVQADARSMDYVYERFYVRFELPSQPLAERLYRQVRQVFLERFDV